MGDEVGDTAVRVVRVSRNNDETAVRVASDLLADMRLAFLREFERLLFEQLDNHPELAEALWAELEEFLARRIREYERRIEVLSSLLEKIRAVRELSAGDPETP
jgi:hypothetical protein